MLPRRQQLPRLGDVSALVRLSRGDVPAGVENAVAKRRRLLALFCKVLGEQILDGKSTQEIASPPLSPRQRQTLELLLVGQAEKQIAAKLAISRHTVHMYVKSLYKRFNVSSRGELLARWVQPGSGM